MSDGKHYRRNMAARSRYSREREMADRLRDLFSSRLEVRRGGCANGCRLEMRR